MPPTISLAANLMFGFGFLGDRANFDIPFHLISWVDADTYGRALLVSLLNTLLVSAMGIVAATLLGLLVGIMRLSVNWLMRNVALAFIEFVRNTPQLVQIIFWYFAVLQTLPPPRGSIAIPGGFLLNIRGLYMPGAVMGPGSELLSLLALPSSSRHLSSGACGFGAHRIGAKALVLPLVAALLLVAGIERIEFPTLKRLQHHRRHADPARARRACGRACRSIPPPSSPRSCAAPSRRCRKGSTKRPIRWGFAARPCCS